MRDTPLCLAHCRIGDSARRRTVRDEEEEWWMGTTEKHEAVLQGNLWKPRYIVRQTDDLIVASPVLRGSFFISALNYTP